APGIGGYGMSKAALSYLTAQLAFELAPSVRVNAVAPAIVRTRFARALYEGREAEVLDGYPLGRLGEPEDVAAAVAFLLSEQASWVTGQTLVLDGGSTLVGGFGWAVPRPRRSRRDASSSPPAGGVSRPARCPASRSGSRPPPPPATP